MSKTKTQSKTKKRPQQPQFLTPELTKLYPLTKKLINDRANSIIETHLKPYLTKFVNNNLCMSGSVLECFWSPKFMDPILENAIVEVLNQTAETCRKAKAKLDPEPYLWEASESLKTILVGRIYDYMAYIDKTMRGKDWPEHKIRLRVSDKIAKMSELVEQHAAAVNLISVSPQPQTPLEKPAETKQDITPIEKEKEKFKIIGWLLKKTSRLVGAIIVAIIGGLIVAILIDIFGDFGWLEGIKTFIYKILHVT